MSIFAPLNFALQVMRLSLIPAIDFASPTGKCIRVLTPNGGKREPVGQAQGQSHQVDFPSDIPYGHEIPPRSLSAHVH